MSNSNVVELFDEQGNPISYRKLSARIPEFLKDYSPKEGYAVVVTTIDPISLKPGLLRLYEASINAGKSFEECGLPSFSGQESLVYQAQLINVDRVVLCSRSAVMQVSEYKDHETGETAAVQRLLSALGYDGSTLDDDESKDFSKQGLTEKPGTTADKPTVVIKAEATKPAAVNSSNKSDNSDKKKNPHATTEKEQPKGVSDTLVIQLKNLSDIKSIPIPEYTDLKGAKQALKVLQSA